MKISQHLQNYISADELIAETERAKSFLPELAADPMAGWLDLPENYSREEFSAVTQAAEQIRFDSQYLVCIGIGGSYLANLT